MILIFSLASPVAEWIDGGKTCSYLGMSRKRQDLTQYCSFKPQYSPKNPFGLRYRSPEQAFDTSGRTALNEQY